MASLTSEFSLAVMPGPKLVPNFSLMTNRKGMNTNAGIVYHDESNPEVVAEIEKRQKEFDCEKAVKLTRPGKREGLQMRLGIKREQHLFGTRQFGQDANLMKNRICKREGLQMRLGIKREQHLFGTRQFGQDANLMKARHTQDLNSIEQISAERLDPSCCRRRVLGNHDMYMQRGRGASEKLRAESPPRQNPELMEKTKVYRELRPGEGKLSNIAELSKVAGDIKQLRRERKWIPLEEG